LAWVASLIQRTQNYYVDISARIPELGRQPYSARRFFIENQDRVLFGTDNPADAETYRAHYRFLESDDEYFAYADPEAIPENGRWRIYGLYLPSDVLEKVYWKNAERVLKISNQ
jgi:predicted TIM-barrel fold metal-dependent hydrolase